MKFLQHLYIYIYICVIGFVFGESLVQLVRFAVDRAIRHYILNWLMQKKMDGKKVCGTKDFHR